MSPPRFCRILLIEDDELRIETIQSWLPEDIRLVVARSAGRAIGTLRMDPPDTYAGVMLDRDLHQHATSTAELALSGTNLVGLIIQRVDLNAAVMVHSMNLAHAPSMVDQLNAAGFWTSYVPFVRLTREGFNNWVSEVRELWVDRA